MTVYYFNLAAASAGIVAALFGLLLALMARYIERWERRYFCTTFSLLLAYTASDLVAQVALVFMGSSFTWLAQAGVFLELLFATAIIPLIAAFLLRCAGESWRDSLLFRFEVILWTVFAVVLVAAQFGDAVYGISADGHRIIAGPLFPALSIPPILLMAVNLVALVRRRASLTQRQRIAFAVYFGIPLASVLLQAVFFDLRIVVVGTAVATLAMFAFVLSEQMDEYVRKREEAYRRQSQVMALQMRPHFIYNVMTSIYYLCAQDPERAQQVTLDFTDYLRANFAAVAADGDTPFAKELEHTRAYLAVERARFEDDLVVDINCPHTAFSLPPLTLQPLVENAVKHGADPERPPLHVRIATRKDSGFSVITVEDNGPGLDNSVLESETRKGESDDLLLSDGVAGRTANPASAIANIRERLAARGSTLDFSSREGGGTVATIRVPSGKRDSRQASFDLRIMNGNT